MLELFAGTLNRYYCDVDTPEEAARTNEIVCHWRDTIVGAVKKAAPEAEPWEENTEKEYLALQLPEMAFGALLTYAASVAYGHKCRETVYPGWNFEAEADVQSARADRSMVMTLLKGASWWLPVQTPIMLRGEVPTGDVVTIASTGALIMELLRINELGWKADEEEVISWLGMEGKLAEGAKRYSTESLAKYAYSVFWQLAKFALQNNVPVIMD
jgi:hypothetical protein